MDLHTTRLPSSYCREQPSSPYGRRLPADRPTTVSRGSAVPAAVRQLPADARQLPAGVRELPAGVRQPPTDALPIDTAAYVRRQEARAREIDQALWRLDRRDHGIDLALGRGMLRILERNGYRQNGYSNFRDFVREHLLIGASQAKQLRRLARAADACPELAAALDEGRLGTCKAIELASVLKSDTPPLIRAVWIRLAERLTVKSLQAAIKAAREAEGSSSAASVDDDSDGEGVMVSIGAPAPVIELFRIAKDLVRKTSGGPVPVRGCAEAIAAEFLSRVGGLEEEAVPAADADATAVAENAKPHGTRDGGASPDRTDDDDAGGAADGDDAGGSVAGDDVGGNVAGDAVGGIVAGDDVGGSVDDESAPPRLAAVKGRGQPLVDPKVLWPELDWSRPSEDEELALLDTIDSVEVLAMKLRELSLGRSPDRLEFARLLAEMRDSHGWEHLGFRSFTQYCELRLGFTLRQAEKLIRFKRALDRFDGLREAFLGLELCYSTTERLIPIVHETSEKPWTAWAIRSSVRDLLNDVEQADPYVPRDRRRATRRQLAHPNESVPGEEAGPAQSWSDYRDPGPLAHANRFVLDWSAVPDGARPDDDAERLRSDPNAGIPADDEDPALASVPVGYSLPPTERGGLPRIAGLAADPLRRHPTRIVGYIRFWAPTEVARVIEHALARARQILGGDGPDWYYWQVILVYFIQSQDTPEARRHLEQFKILARDNFECAIPTCTCRHNMSEHHLRYRGQQGTDEPFNLVGLCGGCHIEGEHRNTLRIGGWAPNNLFVVIGRPNDRHQISPGNLLAFHNGRRADPEYVLRAIRCWERWWIAYQRTEVRDLLPVPNEPLTPDTLAELEAALVECMRRNMHVFGNTYTAALARMIDDTPQQLIESMGGIKAEVDWVWEWEWVW